MGKEQKTGQSPKKKRRWRRTRWTALAFVVAHLLGFVTSVNAVMGVRTPQGTIAWVATLNSFPWVAVPAYWVFGRSDFNGYVTARREERADIDHLEDRGESNIRPYLVELPPDAAALMALERLAEMPFTRGNRAELLIDGDATFDSILEGIAGAEDYILVQFYIVKDDGLGRRLKEALIERARQGVRVYFLYDEIGSHQLPRAYGDDLTEAGASFSAFNTTRGSGNRFQLNFRNHRKIVVVDGHTTWIGGHNVGDEYLGLDPEFGNWRDTHVRIEGPAALAAQLAFVEDWHWATDELPQLSWDVREDRHVDDGIEVLVLPSSPADQRETAGLMFVHAISSARQRIWIASPYFVPDEAVTAALKLAALRGVDVRVLIPDNPDHMLVYLSAFSFLDELKGTGIRIYRYTDGFMHQKVMLVDDQAAAVGTANLDNRSFRLNFEITTMMVDEPFAQQVEEMFLADFRRSRVMDPDEFEERGLWFRFAVRLSRLTAPIL